LAAAAAAAVVVNKKDAPRTFPHHPYFGEEGQSKLKRVLVAYSRRNPKYAFGCVARVSRCRACHVCVVCRVVSCRAVLIVCRVTPGSGTARA
jgi:hypothetical protein